MSSPNSKVSNWLQNNFRLQDLTLERRFNAKNHQLDEPRFNVKNNRLVETRFINDGLLHKEGEIVEISDSPIIENCCSVMNEQNDHLNEFSDIDDFQQLNSPFETLERVAMDSLRDRSPFSRKQRYPPSKSTQWISPIKTVVGKRVFGSTLMHIQIDSRQTSLSKFYFSDQIVPFDFECKYCKKLFSESKKLQRHEKENCRIRKERVGALKKSRIEFVVLDDCDDAVVPNYEQKLVCNVCNQKFKRQSNMVVHKRRKHMIW